MALGVTVTFDTVFVYGITFLIGAIPKFAKLAIYQVIARRGNTNYLDTVASKAELFLVFQLASRYGIRQP